MFGDKGTNKRAKYKACFDISQRTEGKTPSNSLKGEDLDTRVVGWMRIHNSQFIIHKSIAFCRYKIL